MAEARRSALPDNVDPLIDTLSNVVGILVVVVALTQIQLGDALDRLVAIQAGGLPLAGDGTPALLRRHASLAQQLASAEARRDAVLARSSGSVEDALAAAEEAIEQLEERASGAPALGPAATQALERRLEERKKELAAQRAAARSRAEYAKEIQRVPKELVARLPDPAILTGEEAWILCRYDRCYLADRPELIRLGSTTASRVISDGPGRQVRPDEFESLARYFRKKKVGVGDFRWQIITGARTKARLTWDDVDAGIEPSRLAKSRELAMWLAARSPAKDFIRFQVWNDSFEAYLAARQAVEAAGFRAGWRAFDREEELDLYLTFGRRQPRQGPVRVD